MRLLPTIYRLLWSLVVFSLIITALLFSLARLLMTEVDTYRNQFQALLSDYVGQQVTIEDLRADLIGLSPAVVLEGVELSDGGGVVISRFDGVEVELNTLESLRQRRLVLASLTVIGADLEVVRQSDGRINIHGLDTPSAEEGGELGPWLLNQGRLQFRDSRVSWRDNITDQNFTLSSADFILANLGKYHWLSGSVDLPVVLGQRLELQLEVTGNPIERSDWDARLYLNVQGLELGALSGTLNLNVLTVSQGGVDLELWGRWRGGRLNRITGEAALSDVRANYEQRPVEFQRLSTLIDYQSSGARKELQLADARLIADGIDSGPVRVKATDTGEVQELLFDQLDISLLKVVNGWLPEDTGFPVLSRLNPSGKLSQVHLRRDGSGLVGQGAFRQYSQQAYQHYPSLSGFSGRFRFDPRGAEVVLDEENVVIDYPSLFDRPFHFTRLAAYLDLRYSQQGWSLHGRGIEAANGDLELQGDLDLFSFSSAPTTIDLRGNIARADATKVVSYLPKNITGGGAGSWLQEAFRSGAANDAAFLYHGPVDGFPFRQRQGRFVVDFSTQDLELYYQQGWPHLYQTDASVRFDGPALSITGQTRMFDDQLNGVQVNIDDLADAYLELQLDDRVEARTLLRTLTETPLNAMGGSAVEGMSITGESRFQLDLGIVLNGFEQAERPVRVKGEVDFDGNRYRVTEGVAVDGLQGRLAFTDNSYDSEGMSGEIYGKPLQVTVYTTQPTEERTYAETVVSLHGGIEGQALAEAAPLKLLQSFNGTTDWQGTLRIPHAESEGVLLTIESSLKGLESRLPAPFIKSADEARASLFRLHLSGQERGRVILDYGNQLAVNARLEWPMINPTGVAINVGDSVPEQPEQGQLIIRGGSLSFDSAGWREMAEAEPGENFIDAVIVDLDLLQLVEAKEEGDSGTKPEVATGPQQLPELDINIRNLRYGNTRLGHFRTTAFRDGEAWLLRGVRFDHKEYTLTGRGSVIGNSSPHTQLELELNTPNIGQAAKVLDVASVISEGKAKVGAKLNWPGGIGDMEMAQLGGWVDVQIRDGNIDDVNVGAGRLLGLFSLQELPRRLFLDFSDLFQSGMEFNEIKGRFRLDTGNAYTQDLHLRSSTAKILVTGRTGLVERDFDKKLIVIPNVSDTVSIVGGISLGPQVGAVLLLLQKLFESGIEEATMIEYHLGGSWEEPLIEKIGSRKVGVEEGAPVEP